MINAGTWRDRWRNILSRIHIVHDETEQQSLLNLLTEHAVPKVLAFVNAHAMNSMVSNHSFYEALSDADLILRDGAGMSMLLKHEGISPGLNMNGTDLIPRILESFAGRRVALWGTAEPYLGIAASRCESIYGVRVVSCCHGFDDEAAYLDLARNLQLDLIILGMGMPKQERVSAMIRAAGIPSLVVCGGAILDFLGGKVSRSPMIFRRLGLEWLFRLGLEPKRLFRRYVIGNPAFLWRIFSL